MKLKNVLTSAAFGVALSMQATTAFAAYTANITSIAGSWGPVTGGTSVTGIGTSSISWGGVSPPSGYDFIASATPINGIAPNGASFDLGDFQHRNEPIPSGTAISGARLTVNVAGDLVNGSTNPFSINSVFDFVHDETPNVSGQCPAGSVSICDDIVTVTLNTGASDSLVVDGVEYFFTIDGFYYNDALFSSFLTEEGKTNVAELRGSLTASPVPIPAAAWLFGSALLGVIGVGRRRSRVAAAA